MKKAVITILGIQGGYVENEKANFTGRGFNFQARYYFPNEEEKQYFNTLPLLIDRYAPKGYEIIPLYTTDAKIFNEKILQESNKQLHFPEKYHIKDEKKFKEIFALFNQAIDEYDEIIIDLTHGFRHLPLLMLVDLLIQNFKNSDKVKQILFAMEVEKHLPNLTDKEQRGLYEFIDLKEYLDLSNIAFIISTFDENYTVANHIKTHRYNSLIEALNDVSNDIMALNLNNLFNKSTKTLIHELQKIKEPSIKNQALKLKQSISKTFKYAEKRYLTYFYLSKALYDKKYMLLSLSLLFESIRLYIKTSIKREYKKEVEFVEKALKNDLYKIGDFFKNLKWKSYDKYQKDLNKINIDEKTYNTLKKAFPNHIKDLYDEIDRTRNNLSHANSRGTFKDIEEKIESLLNEYEEKCIKQKGVKDLLKHFG